MSERVQGKKLTKRQCELVMHLANGMRIEEIAVECHLSLSSVEKTFRVARARVGARTLPHLVSIAIASGAFEWNPEDQMRLLNGDHDAAGISQQP